MPVVMTETPVGLRWRAVVGHWVERAGGWADLSDELIRRVSLAGGEPPAHDAALKGLRRLAEREQRAGGRYGSWLLRHFGVPGDVEAQLAWLAQYHSRFSDLPTSLRRDHLRLWDRPPISESRQLAWVHVGLASVHQRRREPELVAERLAAAQRIDAGPLATMEAALLEARVTSGARQDVRALALLDRVETLLDDDDPAHLPYRTRLHGQRAFMVAVGKPAGDPAHREAQRLFQALPADTGVPFVDYRRTAGLAYCAWRLGDTAAGVRLAREAAEHAGDGGLVRFRAMALNMLARMVEGEEAVALRRRAERLARSIEDAHLVEVTVRYR